MFEYTEYHIYTINENGEKIYAHLTNDELKKAQSLNKQAVNSDSDWQTTHRLKVADNTYLIVGDAPRISPSLQSRGYEGRVPVRDGDFEKEIFFDSTIFYKCIGDHGFKPDLSFADVKEWVNYEHREQFENEFDEYLTSNYDPNSVIVDW